MEQQKFTEGIDFETDEWFIESLKEFPEGYRIEILEDVLPTMRHLPVENGWTQQVAGVIKEPQPIFYLIEFLKQDNELPYLVDIKQIDVDDYLDAVLEKNTIEHYDDKETL